MNGWFKFHKQTIHNEIWRKDLTAWHIFEGLLMLVNTNTGDWAGGRFQLSELLLIKPTTLYKAIKRLEKAKMVTLSSNNKYTTIHICNWTKYQAHSNNASNNKVTTKGQQSNTLIRTKDIEDIKNTNVLAKANKSKPVINEMFNYWNESVGYEITSRIQANRYACNNLLRKHGEDNLRKLIDGVAIASSEKYAPSISDFSDLQAKFNSLILWGKKQSTAVKRKVVI